MSVKAKPGKHPGVPGGRAAQPAIGLPHGGAAGEEKLVSKAHVTPEMTELWKSQRIDNSGWGGSWKVPFGDCSVPDDRVLPGSHVRQDDNEAGSQQCCSLGKKFLAGNGVASLSASVWP